MIHRLIKILAFILLFVPVSSFGAHLADCNKTTLDAAIADTTTYPNGSTIELPSCAETTWSDWVTVDRALTIKGQTTTSRNTSTYAITATDNTIITGKGFSVSADSVKITGITFKDLSIANPDAVIITPSGGYTRLHIYGNHFNNCDARLVSQKRDNSGLLFYLNLVTQPAYETLYIVGSGKASWDLGGPCGDNDTTQTTWIEDNEFRLSTANSVNVVDAGEGARVTIRGNLFTGTETYSFESNVIENHGHCYTYRDFNSNWGTYCMEVYDNKFSNPADPSYIGQNPFQSRGGRAYFYGNTISNTGWYPYGSVGLINNETTINCNSTPCANQDHADGGYHAVPISDDPSFSGSPLLCTSYPCPMQINNSYIFANTSIARPGYTGVKIDAAYSDIIQIDRDYWSDRDENGTEVDTYGSGTALPDTCVTHDIYWHIDTSKLYRCTATDTWAEVYASYAYPHPLRQTTNLLRGRVTGNLSGSVK